MAGTTTSTARKATSTAGALAGQLPVERLKQEARGLGEALTHKGFEMAGRQVESLSGRLSDYAEGKVTPTVAKNIAEGDSPAKAGVKAVASKVKDTVKDKVTGALGGGKGGGKAKLKVTNIVESIDVPVSREVAYAQWTQFEDFPSFMKKVERVTQDEDEKVTWKAQVFWSHREWKATILDQVPPERIVWKSEGQKGHVDGAVTFHELAPDLTRVLVVLEYHPQGLFEHTGNIWRAQGRRARLELKHYRRHVATHTLIHADELDGWKGTIHDGHVVEEEAADESEDEGQQDEGQQGEQDHEDRSEDQQDEQEQGEQDRSEDEQEQGEQRARRSSSAAPRGTGTPRRGTSQRASGRTKAGRKPATAGSGTGSGS